MNMDSSFETKILEQKTEKLAFSLVVISVLIPAVIIAIGFFGYAELKNSIKEINSNKEKSLSKLSSEFKDTIFKNASKTEAVESRINDLEARIKSFSNETDTLNKKIVSLNSTLGNELQKKITTGTEQSAKNSRSIKSVSEAAESLKNTVEKLSKEVRSNTQHITKTQDILNKIGDSTDYQKTFNEKIDSIKNEVLAISKKSEALYKEIESLKNNKELSDIKNEIKTLSMEIKKKEIEERITKKRLDDIESFLKNQSSDNSGFSEKNLLEQDLKE